MDVLLSHGYFIKDDPKEQAIMRPYPPLGLLYISAYLKENEVDVSVFDSTFSSFEEQQKTILTHQPKIIALYANLMTKINLIRLMSWIRNQYELKDTLIVLGGPDVTYNVENYLSNGADFLVIGEGEETMLELSMALLENKSVDEIPGIAFKKDTEIVQNLARQKIRKIDDLPMPDRSAIDLNNYLEAWKTHHGKSALSVSTQRGCPYTCKWCSTAVYGQSYRRRSVKLVADEIEYLQQHYQPDSIWFVDDVFTVSHKWIGELHAEFQQRNLFMDFECITRAERLTDEVLVQLKEMGCSKIWIGAESGSQKIVNAMDRRVDIHVVRERIRKAREIGIGTGTFIMLGYPEETMNDIRETVTHLKSSLPDQFTITVTYPIAGTDLYEQVKPLITEQPNWSTSTDRDIDFQRTYSRKFYDYAVRYVVNSVNAHKSWKQDRSVVGWSKGTVKSMISRMGMTLNK